MYEGEDEKYNKKGEINPNRKHDNTLGADGKPKRAYINLDENWKKRKWNNIPGQSPHGNFKKQSHGFDMETGKNFSHPKGKNPGDIFHINPMPFPEAHFATFPLKLPMTVLECSCPKQVCKKCSKPRVPIDDKLSKCDCDAGFKPGVVLDPFMGAGTTALAAHKLGLEWLGIELNPESIDIAKRGLGKESQRLELIR